PLVSLHFKHPGCCAAETKRLRAALDTFRYGYIIDLDGGRRPRTRSTPSPKRRDGETSRRRARERSRLRTAPPQRRNAQATARVGEAHRTLLGTPGRSDQETRRGKETTQGSEFALAGKTTSPGHRLQETDMPATASSTSKVVSREAWVAARKELLKKEK